LFHLGFFEGLLHGNLEKSSEVDGGRHDEFTSMKDFRLMENIRNCWRPTFIFCCSGYVSSGLSSARAQAILGS
jgi:hypothetical protein